MCTAVYYRNRYFGRNLDYERSFGEEVVTMPRGFSFPLGEGEMQTKYAVIGMAHVEDGIPLFYDGMNEKGLAMAGLLFAGKGIENHHLFHGFTSKMNYHILAEKYKKGHAPIQRRGRGSTLLINSNVITEQPSKAT